MTVSQTNWILPAGAIVVFMAVVAVLVAAREPRFEGRTGGAWIIAASQDPGNLADYGAVFVRANEAGARFLARQLVADPPRWKLRLISFYNQHAPKLGLRHMQPNPGAGQKPIIRKLLGYCGDQAAPELNKLLTTASMPNRLEIIRAMAELGPDAAPIVGPQLLPLLSDPLDNVVYEVITTLAVVGYDPATVVPRVIPFLQHANYRVRIEASYALGVYAPMPELTLDPLIAALADSNQVVRANSARALGFIGKPAAPALEPLAKLLKDDPLVSARAVEAIAMIAGNQATGQAGFTTAHATHLASTDRYNQLMVLRASRRLGWSTPALEEVFSDLLRSQSNWQVWEAVDALAELEPRPAWADRLLEKASEHSNGRVRAKAEAALGR